jgi:hypothetical protein
VVVDLLVREVVVEVAEGLLWGLKVAKIVEANVLTAEEELNMAVEANESLVYQANHGLVSHSNESVIEMDFELWYCLMSNVTLDSIADMLWVDVRLVGDMM